MSEDDPHQHQAAKGIEFFDSLLHWFPRSLVCKPGSVSAVLLQTMGLYVLPGLRILLQICIPERKRFQLRALEYLIVMAACIREKAGESHVRSTLEFHLEFVACRPLCECLTSPNWLFAKWAEIARTVHKQHWHMNAIPRVRAQTHDAFSLRR